MENRFGVKDFIIIVLLVVVGVLVLIAMKQFDRQWDDVKSISARVDGQAQELRQIHDALNRGIVVANNGGPTTQGVAANVDDPFARIRAATTQPGFAKGDWMIEMFPGQVAKLTPLLSGDVYASDVQDYVLESLAQRDPETLKWTGLIASEWKITTNPEAYEKFAAEQRKLPRTDEDIKKDPGAPEGAAFEKFAAEQRKLTRTNDDIAKDPKAPEAVHIRFKLRDGVHFSDGTPLTADDVVFTYNFIMNEKIAAPRQRAYMERIRRVEKIGPLEVEFVYTEPYFEAFDLAAGFGIMPKHFYEQFQPEDFNQSVGYLMGSGPYRMEDPKSWKPGMLIQLVRNERYWGLQPAFDRHVFKEISSDKARLSTFRNGEADRFGASPEQYRELIKDQGLMSKVKRFEFQSPTGGYRYVAWNEKNALFADKRVRQALTMLLDRERMIQEIALGYGVMATGPFNPSSNQYNKDVKAWPYDVDAAKKLLTDVGFTLGSDGVLHMADGKAFEFKLTYPAGGGNYDRMALFMKDAYAKAGIVLKPDPLEWGAFTQRLEDKNFEAISLGWSAGIETDVFQMFHSSQMGPGGDDFMSYKNEEFDRLCAEARSTMDESKRMPLWQKCHAILHEDQPYTFLWFGKSLVFIDNRIENIQLTKTGMSSTNEWYVPSGKQKWTK
jgi:peptide/nickel transport system substrate-binding protein